MTYTYDSGSIHSYGMEIIMAFQRQFIFMPNMEALSQ